MRTSTRQILSLTLLLAFTLSLANPANAEPTPSPTALPSDDPIKTAKEKYKKEREIYQTAVREHEISMREINFAFKIAVDKANFDARIAIWAATTPERKSALASARRSAVAAAIVMRDAAINDLGPIPVPPISLQKGMKSWQEGKGKRRP